MFSLSRETITPDTLRTELANATSGALVTFEGWVRDHNEGKSVHRLDYEAYESMALKEGTRIVQEAIDRFGLSGAHCVHRIGELAIGDVAVWAGAASPHRAEAFAACRFIIDEVKHRLPIWKKEHYTDGDSGWVNCEACAGHHTRVEFSENDFYDRQIRVPQFGPEGQAKLREARVLVVGAGGLGAPVLEYLAASGVGTIGICDGDRLEVSNLHRQPLFNHADIGKPKAALAAARIRALNPFITVNAYTHRITLANVEAMLDQHDVVLNCTDNFETKFLLNDAAVMSGKVLIAASIHQFDGQLTRYVPGTDTPCLRCLWPEIPEPGCIGSCAEIGVLGFVPGILGMLQAAETVKHIVGLPDVLEHEMLLVDCVSFRVQRLRTRRDPACPVCGTQPAITALDEHHDYGPDDVDISWADLAESAGDFALLDMRDEHEIAAAPIEGFRATPIDPDAVFRHPERYMNGQQIVLCCPQGLRSRSLAMHLRRLGYNYVYSLQGGTDALKRAARTAAKS